MQFYQRHDFEEAWIAADDCPALVVEWRHHVIDKLLVVLFAHIVPIAQKELPVVVVPGLVPGFLSLCLQIFTPLIDAPCIVTVCVYNRHRVFFDQHRCL
jgi:hypothetical protein